MDNYKDFWVFPDLKFYIPEVNILGCSVLLPSTWCLLAIGGFKTWFWDFN